MRSKVGKVPLSAKVVEERAWRVELTRQLWGRNGVFWEEWFQDSDDDGSFGSVEVDNGCGGFEGGGGWWLEQVSDLRKSVAGNLGKRDPRQLD